MQSLKTAAKDHIARAWFASEQMDFQVKGSPNRGSVVEIGCETVQTVLPEQRVIALLPGWSGWGVASEARAFAARCSHGLGG